MANDNIPELKIDPVFERLVQPLDEKMRKELCTNIKKDPSLRLMTVWNGYLLGDSIRYRMCKLQDLPMQIDDKSFYNYDHAASFLCSKQLTRTDLTGEYRKYLIGQKFLFEEKKFLAANPDKTNAKYRTAYQIGERINLSGNTVLKYNVYAIAMNTIFDQSPDFALRILMGKTRVSHENVIELSRLTPDEIKNVARAAINENIPHLTFSDIRHEVKYSYTQSKAPVSRRERKEQKERVSAGIRQMPVYDPDADVNSLCMTINSWVSSIERVNQKTNFSTISNRAMLELMKQLTILDRTINSIQKSLVERTANNG